jgi:intracellular sulfur oxidation DsrE/DsrF family protein
MTIFKKKSLLFILVMTILTTHASDHKVVFELTSDDRKNWETLLNNLENVRKELGPKTQVEVVVHGNGIGFLIKKNDFQKTRMLNLANEGVKFLGCENTMRRKDIKRNALYDFAGTVPAGLAEIIRKQKKDWAYIKIAP